MEVKKNDGNNNIHMYKQGWTLHFNIVEQISDASSYLIFTYLWLKAVPWVWHTSLKRPLSLPFYKTLCKMGIWHHNVIQFGIDNIQKENIHEFFQCEVMTWILTFKDKNYTFTTFQLPWKIGGCVDQVIGLVVWRQTKPQSQFGKSNCLNWLTKPWKTEINHLRAILKLWKIIFVCTSANNAVTKLPTFEPGIPEW